MPKLLRLIIAIVLGFAAGSAVNIGLILVGGSVSPFEFASVDINRATDLQVV